MKNITWTTDFLTLEILPCGTIHMELSSEDADTGEEFLCLDKVNKIVVEVHEVGDTLSLECDDMVYDFPDLGSKFLEETNGSFPVSDTPTPVKPMTILAGSWTEEGKPNHFLYIQDNQLHFTQTTPAGDQLTTTF